MAAAIPCHQVPPPLGRQQKQLATGIRTWGGRSFFELNLEKTLTEKKRKGSEFFAIERFEMEVKNKNKMEVTFMPFFYCKNVVGLFKFIA